MWSRVQCHLCQTLAPSRKNINKTTFELVLGDSNMRGITTALSLLLVGCVSYSDHVWTRTDPLRNDIKLVPPEKLSSIGETELEHATALLEKVAFVELGTSELARLGKRSPVVAPGERVFLLRGVSWNRHPPFFRKVFAEKSTKVVYVFGYAWNGEISMPFQKHQSVASPLIVSLDFVPETIIPRAIMGGDAVFMQKRGAFHEDDK